MAGHCLQYPAHASFWGETIKISKTNVSPPDSNTPAKHMKRRPHPLMQTLQTTYHTSRWQRCHY